MPKRIQRKRAKGWRMPPGTVVVDRTSKWGNPFLSGVRGDRGAEIAARRAACDLFEAALVSGELPYTVDDARRELRGKDLACFCPLDQPCHADVLLRIASTGKD